MAVQPMTMTHPTIARLTERLAPRRWSMAGEAVSVRLEDLDALRERLRVRDEDVAAGVRGRVIRAGWREAELHPMPDGAMAAEVVDEGQLGEVLAVRDGEVYGPSLRGCVAVEVNLADGRSVTWAYRPGAVLEIPGRR